MSSFHHRDTQGPQTKHAHYCVYTHQYTQPCIPTHKLQEEVSRVQAESRRLLERDKARAVGGSVTRATVLHRLVGDGELAQVETSHLGLQAQEGTI